MSLEPLIVEYAAKLREMNVAKTTIKSYCARVRAFDRWLLRTGAFPTVVDFNLPVLERWINHRVAEGDRPRTRIAHIDALRNFGEWLVASGRAPSNPAKALDKPQLDAPVREHITDEEMELFLAACDLLPDARKAAMAKAVVSLMAFSAIRRGELLNLHLSDVILSQQRRALLIRSGKGQKEGMVPLVSEAVAAILAWLAVRGDCRHPFLFDIDHTRRLGDQGLRNLLRAVAAAAGRRGAVNFKPHSIRHNCADRMHRNGAPIRDVQALLRHERLSTTEIYLRDGTTHLFEIAEDALGFRKGESRQESMPKNEAPVKPPAPPEPNHGWRRRIHIRR